MPIQARRASFERHNIYQDVQADANKSGVAVEEIVTARITEDHLITKSREALSLKSRAGFRIFLIMVTMGFNQAASINSNIYWHNYFGFENSDSALGVINALMTIGNFCGTPFLSVADKIGRRSVNFLGCFLTIVASLIQCFAPNVKVFMFGRFVLGFGTALCTSSQYIAEVAPPHLRGPIVGIFGAYFHVGCLAIVGIMMGFTHWENNWSWIVAFLIQAIFPFFVLLSSSEDPNHPFVETLIAQIDESIETSAVGFRAVWDLRVFFTKAVGFRTFVLLLYSTFQQWNGGDIIGLYMDPALQTIGITKKLDVLGVTLGLTATYFVFTLFAAAQVEGARNKDGKGVSIWDTFAHTPGKVKDGSTGDDAVKSYDSYKTDSRIIPLGGKDDAVNEEGISYYNRLIDELLANNIIPFVTLFHWDIPQKLEDRYGGMLNKDADTPDFVRYARVCFERFGDRVKNWITYNEPGVYSLAGYAAGLYAPSRSSFRDRNEAGGSSTEPFIVSHTELVSHAYVADIYNREFKPKQNGTIMITLHGNWSEPWDVDDRLDQEAAERAREFEIAWFGDPLYKTGDYPESMRAQLGDRLPRFTPEESKLVLGSSEFYAINSYSAFYVRHRDGPADINDHLGDVEKLDEIRKLLRWIWNRYGVPIYITENGTTAQGEHDWKPNPNGPDDVWEDHFRVEIYKSYLTEVAKASQEGGVIKSYFGWTFTDNWEWAAGFSDRFVAIWIDLDKEDRKRVSRGNWFLAMLTHWTTGETYNMVVTHQHLCAIPTIGTLGGRDALEPRAGLFCQASDPDNKAFKSNAVAGSAFCSTYIRQTTTTTITPTTTVTSTQTALATTTATVFTTVLTTSSISTFTTSTKKGSTLITLTKTALVTDTITQTLTAQATKRVTNTVTKTTPVTVTSHSSKTVTIAATTTATININTTVTKLVTNSLTNFVTGKTTLWVTTTASAPVVTSDPTTIYCKIRGYAKSSEYILFQKSPFPNVGFSSCKSYCLDQQDDIPVYSFGFTSTGCYCYSDAVSDAVESNKELVATNYDMSCDFADQDAQPVKRGLQERAAKTTPVPSFLPNKTPSVVSSACSCLITKPAARQTFSVFADPKTIQATMTTTKVVTINKKKTTLSTTLQTVTSTVLTTLIATGTQSVTKTQHTTSTVTKPVTVFITNFNTVTVTQTVTSSTVKTDTIPVTKVNTVPWTRLSTVLVTKGVTTTVVRTASIPQTITVTVTQEASTSTYVPEITIWGTEEPDTTTEDATTTRAIIPPPNSSFSMSAETPVTPVTPSKSSTSMNTPATPSSSSTSTTTPGWQLLDNNAAAISIVADGADLYQLHSSGLIWFYTGTPIIGWRLLGNKASTTKIDASKGNLYQLRNTGEILKYTGTPVTGWQLVDNNPAALDIVASGNDLYQLHESGFVYKYTGTPITGWQQLSNSKNTFKIAASSGNLYRLDNDGTIWKYNGVPLTGWVKLRASDSGIKEIVARNADLYELDNNGSIWQYTGVPITGWRQLDNNFRTMQVAAGAGGFYQLHNWGAIWLYTGTPFTGWKVLDTNSAITYITAGDSLYQLRTTGYIYKYNE
ncbi:beta-glucosidase [Fusarium sp. NRRL 52700]|nr:beta-glucosidase [Fusarium sp. NRRL 52700]